MPHPPFGRQGRRRCALYVDFDNMYLGLKADSARAAEVFATQPGRWLAWLEAGLTGLENGDTPLRRSILVRRCYLNPSTFGSYRAYFTRAGFSVVDCPPFTQRTKNSADIVMVMDILDGLEHPTHFNEFIIMSGDADFTPVFYRLRAHDRRITALVSTPTAAAFRAACDLLIPEDAFVEHALGVSGEDNGRSPEEHRQILDRMAARLAEALAEHGPIGAADLPQYYKEFEAFRTDGNWLGYGGLRPLTEAVAARDPRLRLAAAGDSWELTLAPAGDDATETPQPPPPSDRLADFDDPLADFIRRVSALTDAPKLTPAEYRTLFTAIAEELARTPYNLVATSKAVRDRCAEAGRPVPRAAVSWVLKGLVFSGYDLATPGRRHDPRELARAFHDNLRTLLQQARAELNSEEEAMLRRWLVGEE